MRDVIASIESEFQRCRKLGEGAFGQVADADLPRAAPGDGNSLVTLIQHIAGNFLTIPPGKSAEYNRSPSLEKSPMASAAPQDGIAERILKAVSGPAAHRPSLDQLLGDVTAAEAAAHPSAGRHSIGEIVQHIVFWCDDSRRRLPTAGAEGALPEPAEGTDWPPFDAGDAPGWKRVLQGVGESHRALAAAVRLLSPDRLAATVPGWKATCEDMLRGVEHAAFHGGQIAILRRSLREQGGR